MGPADFLGELRPPTMRRPGAGGWRAISRPKNELQYDTVSCKNGGVLNCWTRDGDRAPALQVGGNSCQKFIGGIGCVAAETPIETELAAKGSLGLAFQ